ncbi:10561_t:CDS:2 [Entrophospora sp. SA101]|nr:10561_t:CDS:2 [Entrophospora sp. SA101]
MAITFLGVESSFGIGGVSGRLISKVQRVQSAFKKLVDLIQDNAESKVAYDKHGDRDNGINKITCIQPHCPNTEFMIIVLPTIGLPLPANPNPGVASMVGTPKTARPSHAPYLGHWLVGNTVRWYKMKWNRHLVLGCGANIDFNDILQVLT